MRIISIRYDIIEVVTYSIMTCLSTDVFVLKIKLCTICPTYIYVVPGNEADKLSLRTRYHCVAPEGGRGLLSALG